MFISKFEVTEKNVIGAENMEIFFSLSHKHKKEKLHLLKFYIAGAQVPYINHKSRNSYAHISATVVAMDMWCKTQSHLYYEKKCEAMDSIVHLQIRMWILVMGAAHLKIFL